MMDVRGERAGLINIPFIRACIVKWNDGVEKYGLTFQGEPLECAFAEFVDAVNYVDQFEMMMFDLEPQDIEDLAWVRDMSIACAAKVQALHRRRKESVAA